MVSQALPEATSDALLACRRNQAECAAYRGPDTAGAWAGLCDWLMEECLILLDSAVEAMAEAEKLGA